MHPSRGLSADGLFTHKGTVLQMVSRWKAAAGERMSRFTYHLPILGYHRVGPHKGDHVPTVPPEAFERQLSYLSRHRYGVLSVEEFVDVLDGRRPAPHRSVVITFDDGYEETHTVAWPLLKRFGFPATVFVTPDEVGRSGFLTWEQVIELSNDAVTIGCHTMSHSYLPLVREDRLATELVESKHVIEQRIRRPVQFIGYPIGGFTPAAQAIVKHAGYLAAFTTNRTASRAVLDRYALRRIKVTERDADPLRFWAKVSGYYDSFRELRQPS